MKRINLKFLLVFITLVVVGAASVFFLRRFQVRRNAGNLASLAKQRLEEGKPAEAIMLYGRYIGLRPEDAAAFAEYAKLVLARADAPDATRNDLARAYNTLETAVRRNPDNDDLRRRLAEFQLRIGRSIDAREHLAVLKERLAAGDLKDAPASKDEPDRKPLDASLINILTARSLLGSNDFEEAANLVAAMVGFDMTTRQFSSDAAASAATEAYLMLGAILEEKLNDKEAASRVLDRLIRDQKQDVQAWLARSSWYRQHGNLDAAEADINEAIALDPDNVNSIFAGFELALSRKDFEAARTLAEKGRELAPGDERAYRGLAAVALQRGDLAVAEQVLLDGVEQLPTKASLLLMLSDTLLQQNKLEEVAQSIARIKELYGPSSPAVGLLEGRLLVAQRKWADAKTKLEAVRPMVVGSPDLVRQVDLYLGQCHAQLDEFDAQLDGRPGRHGGRTGSGREAGRGPCRVRVDRGGAARRPARLGAPGLVSAAAAPHAAAGQAAGCPAGLEQRRPAHRHARAVGRHDADPAGAAAGRRADPQGRGRFGPGDPRGGGED